MATSKDFPIQGRMTDSHLESAMVKTMIEPTDSRMVTWMVVLKAMVLQMEHWKAVKTLMDS